MVAAKVKYNISQRRACRAIRQNRSTQRHKIKKLPDEDKLTNHIINLVTAYEAGEDDGVYYLAIQFVDGLSLDEQLQKKGPCPEREALTIIRKVADALRVAWNSQKLICVRNWSVSFGIDEPV